MNNFYVAKSYTDWTRETEPYEANGRMYIKVRSPKGVSKQVRAYTEQEYQRLYGKPALATVQPDGDIALPHKVKNILGFQEGYIWIFKGDIEQAEYWFSKTPECRFHVTWGWYIVSTETVPFDMPSCIQTVQLPWEKVGNADGTLLPKATIVQAIDELLYSGHPSKFQGNIGERLERTLVLVNTIDLGENQYGSSQMYCFEDLEQNQYAWITGVKKSWATGEELHLRGTVKNHDIYKNVKRTLLTRVMEVK